MLYTSRLVGSLSPRERACESTASRYTVVLATQCARPDQRINTLVGAAPLAGPLSLSNLRRTARCRNQLQFCLFSSAFFFVHLFMLYITHHRDLPGVD